MLIGPPSGLVRWRERSEVLNMWAHPIWHGTKNWPLESTFHQNEPTRPVQIQRLLHIRLKNGAIPPWVPHNPLCHGWLMKHPGGLWEVINSHDHVLFTRSVCYTGNHTTWTRPRTGCKYRKPDMNSTICSVDLQVQWRPVCYRLLQLNWSTTSNCLKTILKTPKCT